MRSWFLVFLVVLFFVNYFFGSIYLFFFFLKISRVLGFFLYLENIELNLFIYLVFDIYFLCGRRCVCIYF